jgi:hypothetical protein
MKTAVISTTLVTITLALGASACTSSRHDSFVVLLVYIPLVVDSFVLHEWYPKAEPPALSDFVL